MQKIDLFLWFDNHAEEAVNFYISIFSQDAGLSLIKDNSKITNITYYSEEAAKAARRQPGTVMIVSYELAGLKFIALNGGPLFKFSPSVSFFVSCETEEEINLLWKNFSQGGIIRMELVKYPFSEKFGWVEDKFGVSWQLNLKKHSQKILPFLWFGSNAEEAMLFYTSVFSSIGYNNSVKTDSKILRLERFGTGETKPVRTVKHAEFVLNGQNFMAMDNSTDPFTPAQSFLVNCDTQEEVDTLWEKLSDGGKKDQCGWLKDKYGLSWQIVPTALGKFMSSAYPEKSGRVMKALLQMTKIEIVELQKAYEQE